MIADLMNILHNTLLSFVILNLCFYFVAKMKLRIGSVSQFITPRWRFCVRCKTSWGFIKWHLTVWEPHSGVCALCEVCWVELTPEQRWPYYEELFRIWLAEGEGVSQEKQEAIRSAVFSGK